MSAAQYQAAQNIQARTTTTFGRVLWNTIFCIATPSTPSLAITRKIMWAAARMARMRSKSSSIRPLSAGLQTRQFKLKQCRRKAFSHTPRLRTRVRDGSSHSYNCYTITDVRRGRALSATPAIARIEGVQLIPNIRPIAAGLRLQSSPVALRTRNDEEIPFSLVSHMPSIFRPLKSKRIANAILYTLFAALTVFVSVTVIARALAKAALDLIF
jgi:hypothetical protein